MANQKGASLVVALILLTIITLVAAYSIEGSVIQSKIIASTHFSAQTYHDCRNEQEANLRYYNINGGDNKEELFALINTFEVDEEGDPVLDDDDEKVKTVISSGVAEESSNPITYDRPPITTQYQSLGDADAYNSKSTITTVWSHLKEDPKRLEGYDLDGVEAHVFQNDCSAKYSFSENNQSLGVVVIKLADKNDK